MIRAGAPMGDRRSVPLPAGEGHAQVGAVWPSPAQPVGLMGHAQGEAEAGGDAKQQGR